MSNQGDEMSPAITKTMKVTIEYYMKGQPKAAREFDNNEDAKQFYRETHQDENCESVSIVRERSQPGIGKLEIRPIKDIKAGTTVFMSDGTSGLVVRTWGTHNNRIGTRIIWGQETNEETNQDYLETKTFGVDPVDYAENLAKWEIQKENEAIAEKMENRSSRISLAASYLRDRQKNVELEALDIKNPGERVKRIEELTAKLKETQELRSWFHANQYTSGLRSVGSACYVYATFDEAIRTIQEAISALEPIDEEKFKDWGIYIAEMADEVDKWTEK